MFSRGMKRENEGRRERENGKDRKVDLYGK
jgi:hypothetical protein